MKTVLALVIVLIGPSAMAENFAVKGSCTYQDGRTFVLNPEDSTKEPYIVAMGFDNKTGVRAYAGFQDKQLVFAIQTSKSASLALISKDVFLSGHQVQVANAEANNPNSMLVCTISKIKQPIN